MNYYLGCWKKYAVFDGRARRREYWFFTLFNVLVSCAVQLLGVLLGRSLSSGGAMSEFETLSVVVLLSPGYSLAVLLPSLAVSVRRLHDTGRSGWNLLWMLLPIIGYIVLFVFTVLDSQPGPNKYGPNPKETPPPLA
ncbi:MAG: DUF805 domain-containing protein [Puniceicoccales bacterium]|jgi:uncharacterized membrane protein YhaH (DUF805 family)|nr:DUF805 domain-containing protein [Puniceicoccales bacterium]